ncbi:MAG: putative hydrolase of the superfamily [Acidimicrobiaceae bacterium]|nr:putative hydrolase of the superfamily [Acidimicrobiaceae bacterium]
MIRAVCWDFGGVILSNPFEAFARYEQERGLPKDFIRTLNATNPDTNAWSKLERNDVDFAEFCRLFEAEAEAAGGVVDAAELMPLLAGEVRPQMVTAVRKCKERLKTALLTNNWVATDGDRDLSGVLDLFDVIVESSRAGVRKPDPRFYQLALEQLGVEANEAVFLDDLGINLKPAKALGMTTIKVIDPDQALDELEAVVGFSVRA